MERIEKDWQNHKGHIYRYELAARFINNGEMVYDIACGIGYGAKVLNRFKSVGYFGIDKIKPSSEFIDIGTFYDLDLNTWDAVDRSWDVSISFETMEHLYDPIGFSSILKKARRLIILSVPTVPTKHLNIYHLHDFVVQDILNMFTDWQLIHLEDQPDELSHIFVFEREREKK